MAQRKTEIAHDPAPTPDPTPLPQTRDELARRCTARRGDAGTLPRTAALSTWPPSRSSGGSRSRSPAWSGRWTRHSSDAVGDHVRIYEVGPRDGLQNEAAPIPTATKARFIALLAEAGLREIEATSFVAPRAIPQLADADELMRDLPRAPGVRYPVLVPNMRGLARAEIAGTDASAVFTATTDAFTTANIGMTVDESLVAFEPVLARAGELGWWRRGYVSTAFGCPYTGRVEPERAVEVALRLLGLGVDEVCFGDTIGVGVPGQVGGPDRVGRGSRHPARAHRVPFPRHPRDGAGQCRRRSGRRGSLLRFICGRHRRLSVCPGRGRQSRHGRPRLLPRRIGLGDRWRVARRRPRGRPLRRRRTWSSARDQGRPSRRLGSGDWRRNRPQLIPRPSTFRTFCYRPPDGRCRARSEPELRTAQRL